MPIRLPFVMLVMASICAGAAPNQQSYAGPKACATCHKDIADTQSKTAMANTWRGSSAPSLPVHFDERKTESPAPDLRYEVCRLPGGFEFSVTNPHGAKTSLPVQAIIGGQRHGISFLSRIQQVEGLSLQRPALLEGRYAYSTRVRSLVLSPGFPKEKPSDYEDSLGRVLSPSFERRCLTCHGQPDTLGAGKQGGVRCESCHGPALAHVNSMMTGNRGQTPAPAQAMFKPEHLDGPRSMAVCAQCHTGLSGAYHSDPMPGDLLVSSQVPALRNSECFLQSGGGLSCTSCHNPHQDSDRVVERSVDTCLGCHSISRARHAAICPINATSDCVTCHMPSVNSNSFRLTDHWIRVHPEQGIKAAKHDDDLKSQVTPKREFLRMIIVEDREKAEAARGRLAKGDSFRDVAHDMSVDPTAPGGGFIGDMALSDMDPRIAAAAGQLPYGGTSGILDQGGRFVILHRLSRDFRWEANQLFEQAAALKARGDRKGAIEKDQEALTVYPYFLRALVFMGTTMGEAGDARRASEILRFAAQFYPRDSSAQFDLALSLASQSAEQIEAFRRAIELDPDMVAAYESLGAALYSAGQAPGAIDVFRQGLEIDPLSAILYYDLGLALKQQGDETGATRALTLASKLDPEIAARNSK